MNKHFKTLTAFLPETSLSMQKLNAQREREERKQINLGCDTYRRITDMAKNYDCTRVDLIKALVGMHDARESQLKQELFTETA